jgi:hypothetical protein
MVADRAQIASVLDATQRRPRIATSPDNIYLVRDAELVNSER